MITTTIVLRACFDAHQSTTTHIGSKQQNFVLTEVNPAFIESEVFTKFKNEKGKENGWGYQLTAESRPPRAPKQPLGTKPAQHKPTDKTDRPQQKQP